MSKHYLTITCFAFFYLKIITKSEGIVGRNQAITHAFPVPVTEKKNHTCDSNEIRRFRRSYFTTRLPLHCPPCEQIHCFRNRHRRSHCKGGWTLGICDCCKVCAKVEGEECGGHHNYLGKCDEGLVCEPQEPRFVSFVSKGVKKVYEVERGICKKGFSKPYPLQEICKPKCSPEYCMKNPRGICSAHANVEIHQECQSFCQHTSCRACKFVELNQQCATCSKDDFKCIREFGRCIRKQVCKAKGYPCGKPKFNWKSENRFQCQVPSCDPQ